MKRFLAIAIILFSVFHAGSQSDTTGWHPQFRNGMNYVVTTSSGTLYRGIVVNEQQNLVTLEDRVTHERWQVMKSDVVSARIVRTRERLPDAFGENPHAGSYLLSDAAFPFDEGANTQSHWFVLENTDITITENWAVTVNSLAFYPFTIGAKCAFQVGEYNYIGASAFGIANIGASNQPFFIGYGGIGRFTRGTENNNFSVSGGVVGLNANLFAGVSPFDYVNFGFVSGAYCNRFSERLALNLETWYLPEGQIGLGGAGLKLIEDEHTCWNFGCFAFFSNSAAGIQLQSRTVPIPYFGLNRKF
jgi:hypothetical protein